jgi:endonuclease YncB( thermonuclease family)
VDLKSLLFRCLIVATLIVGQATAIHSTVRGNSAQSTEADEGHSEVRKVIRVVDGDTIVVSPNEKVRLIGVDTPRPSTREKSSSVSARMPKSSPAARLKEKLFGWCLTTSTESGSTKIDMAAPWLTRI